MQPSERDHADIALGLDYLHAAGTFDIGQAVVVAGQHVLAVEAAEGTDAMLARVAELRDKGRVRAPRGTGVLVKAPKPEQDRRFDLAVDRPADRRGRRARGSCRHRGRRRQHHRGRGRALVDGAPTAPRFSSSACTSGPRQMSASHLFWLPARNPATGWARR